ncbi:MAG: CaiB/BaiF CoA-transferase family protein [Pseudomonadota bacterium]
MANDHPSSAGGPLSGVSVLDLSRVLAGPWASQLLGDLGAEVIKIERPGLGDDTRAWGPPFINGGDGSGRDAAYFQCANRNKRSVEIDFSKPEGAEIVRRLAEKADILIENFKVGGLIKYGLDYPSIREINPKIVYCSITGFGQDGPYKDRAGYDFMIQAMSGLMSVTGAPDGEPGGEPTKVGVAVSDLFAGMYAAAAILAALRHAEATGEGQRLDVALLDCQIAALANQASSYLATGVAPGRLGNAHPSIAPYQVVHAADAPFVVAVGNDSQFRAFAEAIGAPELADDPRFETNPARVRRRDDLNAAIGPALAARTANDWLLRLSEAGVPAGPINDIEAVLNDPHVKARGVLAGDISQVAGPAPPFGRHPVRFSATPTDEPTAPPALGAHTDDILKRVADAREIALLRERGIFG